MKILNHRRLIAICLSFIILSNFLWAQSKPVKLDVSLNDASQLTIEGAHRFVKIAGITGLHVSSTKTKAFVETSALQADRGSISIWMSPLESMDKTPVNANFNSIFPLMSDHYPLSQVDSCRFSLYYQGYYPSVIARFSGGSFWGQLNYGITPVVYAESLPLQKGQWYNIVVTWDKPKETITMYINGEFVGHNFLSKNFELTNNKIYVGSPLMVLSGLKIQPELLSKEEVRQKYISVRPTTNQPSDNAIREKVTPQYKPDFNFQLDASWGKVYECSFTKKSDLDSWNLQTGDKFRDKFKLDVTKEGLYWETPDIVDTETRGYLWSPVNIEGDQWVEFEFQLVSPKGLALLIMYASGMQGEDIIENYGLRKTGSMGDMLSNYRNYHWEYMRRVEAMRTDVETQYVNKNPWSKSLYVGCIPRLKQNTWHKIRFIKIGNKLYGSLDGNAVFEVEDDAYNNNGPILNSGRVVLRQMYSTAMWYRNFVIYKRK